MTNNCLNIIDDIFRLSEYKNTEKIADYVFYNTVGGKGIRKALFNLISENESRESELTSCMLELLQASLVVIDDIMDNSECRRGQLCYYKKQGMISLKYSAYFMGIISKLISPKCKDIYCAALFNTCLGQILDSKEKKEEDHTEEMYNIIAEYKTSIYTVYLPLVAGYKFMNIEEPRELYNFANTIGIIFQMQDDYLNFHPKESNKTGNDLEEMKLTYFTCKLYTERDNKYVNKYFEKGEVNEYILEKVRSYFPEYQKKVEGYVKKAEELAKTFDLNIFNVIYKLLEKRMIKK
jgi:farnesyl diphosphate synthase